MICETNSSSIPTPPRTVAPLRVQELVLLFQLEQISRFYSLVEEVVGSSELLECLKCHEEESSIQEFVLGSEAVEPTKVVRLLFSLDLFSHLVESLSNRVIVIFNLDTSDPCERLLSVLVASPLHQPTGRFRCENESDGENQCPKHVECDNDPPGSSSVVEVAGTDRDTVGDEDTESDHELISCDLK